MKCRFCGKELNNIFCDLGSTPVANSYVKKDNNKGEMIFPLCAYACDECKLVQVDVYETPESIFKDYAYFSSFSDSWLEHCRKHVFNSIDRFKLNENSFVVEVASNDGYLLKNFVEKGIPVLGIDPAENVAKIAREKGVDTISDFFGAELAIDIARKYKKANMVIGNNVLAHVPNINDFVEGLKNILDDDGVITMEFPHLMNLMKYNQFDTIYHEHFSYLSIIAVKKIFNKHELEIFDIDEIPTHGGSVRIYAKHVNSKVYNIEENVQKIINKEIEFGLDDIKTYTDFIDKVRKIKRDTLEYLIKAKNDGKKIAAYGAPAKGNTFLNYCGVGTDFIDFTVDQSTYKQGYMLPGVHIPIYEPNRLFEEKPDVVVILPWNLANEIVPYLKPVKEYGGEIITFIPNLKKY